MSIPQGWRSCCCPDRAADDPACVHSSGAEELLLPLRRAESALPSSPSRQADIAFVKSFIQSAGFLRALHVHNKVVEVSLRLPPPTPARDDASSLSVAIVSVAAPAAAGAATLQQFDELRRVLQSTHMQVRDQWTLVCVRVVRR